MTSCSLLVTGSNRNLSWGEEWSEKSPLNLPGGFILTSYNSFSLTSSSGLFLIEFFKGDKLKALFIFCSRFLTDSGEPGAGLRSLHNPLSNMSLCSTFDELITIVRILTVCKIWPFYLGETCTYAFVWNFYTKWEVSVSNWIFFCIWSGLLSLKNYFSALPILNYLRNWTSN